MEKNKIIKFTTEEKELLFSLMNRTWQNIGYDTIKLNNGKDVSRSIVMEMVIDADRLRDYAKSKEEIEAVGKFYSLKNYDSMKKIARKAFPLTKYGM